MFPFSFFDRYQFSGNKTTFWAEMSHTQRGSNPNRKKSYGKQGQRSERAHDTNTAGESSNNKRSRSKK